MKLTFALLSALLCIKSFALPFSQEQVSCRLLPDLVSPNQFESFGISENLRYAAVLVGEVGEPYSPGPGYQKLLVFDLNGNGEPRLVLKLHSDACDISDFHFVGERFLRVKAMRPDPNNESGLSLKTQNVYKVYDLASGKTSDVESFLGGGNIRDIRALDAHHYLVVRGQQFSPAALHKFELVYWNGEGLPERLGAIANPLVGKDLFFRPTLTQGNSAWTLGPRQLKVAFTTQGGNGFERQILSIDGSDFSIGAADPRSRDVMSLIVGTARYSRLASSEALTIQDMKTKERLILDESSHFVEKIFAAGDDILVENRISGLELFDLVRATSATLGSKKWLGYSSSGQGLASIEASEKGLEIVVRRYAGCDASLM